MVKTGERVGVVAAPFAGAFLEKGFSLAGAKEAARRVGYDVDNKEFNANLLIPTVGHYGTFFVRQKLDAKLGHTRALARNSVTAWLTELADWGLATDWKMPASADAWKTAYYHYVNTQTGYAPKIHAWSISPGTPQGQRFLASTGIHIGAAIARKVISRTGVSRYFKLGRKGKSLITA